MKKLKSFRLYMPEPPTTPTRVAADFTMEEKSALAESFAPALKRYRRRALITKMLLGGFLACILIGLALPKGAFDHLGMVAMGLVIAGLLIAPRLPSCPGCRYHPDVPFGKFCPECGSKSLETQHRVNQPICCTCGKQMRRRKSRRYKIRYCTHCGFKLDEGGL